jgi:uncharacterized membrane protein
MKKIKYKQYRLYKILIVILLASIASIFVALGNFVIPLIVFFFAALLMFFLKKNVDAKLTDERMNIIGGKASRMVMTISAILMAIAGIILVSLRNTYPQGLIIGNVLIYTECGMMLFYSILFKYYSSRKI